jgi:alpha-galactosidase
MIDLKPFTTPEDIAQSRFWIAYFMTDPARLPISFLYGEKAIAGIPESWNPVIHKNRIDANILQTTFEGMDGATGLAVKVECLEYRDFPVVEWTAWLSNEGEQTSLLISDFLALDGSFDASPPGQADNRTPPRVMHFNGDFYSPEGYTPRETPLAQDGTLTFAPNGGRPCDGAFPYFRLLFEACGVSLAIGWPGQWSASFTRSGNTVQIKTGQEKTHLRLNPGETIRSPRITLLTWTGDARRAVNLWRRWYLSHILPRPDGKPLRPLMALAATDPGEEFTAATEENQLRYMDRFKAAGFDFDVWWIDAGWYPCYNEKHERRWPLTGTWVPDPERFPNGMRPIADNAARHGARLLMWFEPERVTKGSWLDSQHPEWLLRAAGEDTNRLLNLGNPACRTWLTNHVSDLIQQNGIGIYRQDFNFQPLKFWRENDSGDRQGINENFHVQGYLQYWDDLLLRNPGLWIDSCSSGGRRNDMETMRRAVPLHYTDSSYGVHPVKLAFHHTLYQWIPYFKEFTLSWDLETPENYQDAHANKPVDSFSFHCGMAPMIFPIINIRSSTYDHSPEVRMAAIWRRAASLMLYGDYYPLTPFSQSSEKWVVRQFDQPESGKGLVQAIRLAECAKERFIVHPLGLSPDQDYIFENPESDVKLEISGAALVNDGFTVELPQRSGAVWFYHCIKC